MGTTWGLAVEMALGVSRPTAQPPRQRPPLPTPHTKVAHHTLRPRSVMAHTRRDHTVLRTPVCEHETFRFGVAVRGQTTQCPRPKTTTTSGPTGGPNMCPGRPRRLASPDDQSFSLVPGSRGQLRPCCSLPRAGSPYISAEDLVSDVGGTPLLVAVAVRRGEVTGLMALEGGGWLPVTYGTGKSCLVKSWPWTHQGVGGSHGCVTHWL